MSILEELIERREGLTGTLAGVLTTIEEACSEKLELETALSDLDTCIAALSPPTGGGEGLLADQQGLADESNAQESGTEARACTCHPDEAPSPCQRKYAYSECRQAALDAGATQYELDDGRHVWAWPVNSFEVSVGRPVAPDTPPQTSTQPETEGGGEELPEDDNTRSLCAGCLVAEGELHEPDCPVLLDIKASEAASVPRSEAEGTGDRTDLIQSVEIISEPYSEIHEKKPELETEGV